MSAAKNVIRNNFRNMELNEFLAQALKDAGYGGIEVQKNTGWRKDNGICNKTWPCNREKRRWH
jgi:hypothetical protein